MGGRFCVVTGGPGAGTTSLITEIARCGFHTIPESGRAIIREELLSGRDALPWAKPMICAERMLERDLCAYGAAQMYRPSGIGSGEAADLNVSAGVRMASF
ncbi:AAA family ATPase [Oceaniglobus indicus]|uniref:AAA family ATPase n=1 Tax=Oceaniglobus indicus TaxID=2047749 RepID=UPI000C1754EE|nr:AAA family ATPase [Oceaniglobus indicus]